eukprot:542553-Alexandrium_andersonii.AAC.1
METPRWRPSRSATITCPSWQEKHAACTSASPAVGAKRATPLFLPEPSGGAGEQPSASPPDALCAWPTERPTRSS